MRWQSWAEFWSMGGYAPYVWGSVGVCALLMLIEVWQARAARRQVLAQLQTDIAWNDMVRDDMASQHRTSSDISSPDISSSEKASNSMTPHGAQQDHTR